MNDTELLIRFGGAGNINVQTLTDFLNNYKDILHQINSQLGYQPEDLIIEVSPPEHGSFKIKLSPKYEKAILKGLGTIVTGTIAGLLVYHINKPSDPASIQDIENILKKENLVGDKDLAKNVHNIYHNSGADQKINQTFIIVNGDNNITDLSINQDTNEIVKLDQRQLRNFISQFPVIASQAPPKEDVLTDEQTLIVRGLHFEGKKKWEFVFRGYNIKASIKDENFRAKLGVERFGKGDSLRVRLSRKRTYDEELKTYIVDQNSYVIVEVLEHHDRSVSNQSSIDYDR